MNFTGLFFAVLLSTSVIAQDFPAKPVRVVVPFPPGGGADALARLLGPKLANLWGQQVIVENKPGASGHLGADFVVYRRTDLVEQIRRELPDGAPGLIDGAALDALALPAVADGGGLVTLKGWTGPSERAS